MKSNFIRESKQEEFLKKIEAEFKSTLEKRFNEIETKFQGEVKDKKINKPKILGGNVELVPEEKKEQLVEQISPSPTVEEITNEPTPDNETPEQDDSVVNE